MLTSQTQLVPFGMIGSPVNVMDKNFISATFGLDQLANSFCFGPSLANLNSLIR